MKVKHEVHEGVNYLTVTEHPYFPEEKEFIIIIDNTIGRSGGPYTYTFPKDEFDYEDLESGVIRFTSKGKVETVKKPLFTLLNPSIFRQKAYSKAKQVKMDKKAALKASKLSL